MTEHGQAEHDWHGLLTEKAELRAALEAAHCATCNCGCTCGYGGLHEPLNPRCALNPTDALNPTERPTL